MDYAIRSKLRAVSGVQHAEVISNRSLVTVDGIPGKAFESIIWPDTGDPDYRLELAEVIFRAQPAGIEAFGSSLVSVT